MVNANPILNFLCRFAWFDSEYCCFCKYFNAIKEANVLTNKSLPLSITLICGLTKYTILHGSPKFHFRWKDYFMRKCKQNISCISQSYLRIENASCNQMMCGCIIHLSRKGFSMHKIFQAGLCVHLYFA